MEDAEHNFCFKHENDSCRQCDPKTHGGQCGYYCHRCPCPNCLDTFASPFVERLHEQVLDELIRYCQKVKGSDSWLVEMDAVPITDIEYAADQLKAGKSLRSTTTKQEREQPEAKRG